MAADRGWKWKRKRTVTVTDVLSHSLPPSVAPYRDNLLLDELSKALESDELVHDHLNADHFADIVTIIPRHTHNVGERPEDGAEDVLQRNVLPANPHTQPPQHTVHERDERHKRDEISDNPKDERSGRVRPITGRIENRRIGAGKGHENGKGSN